MKVLKVFFKKNCESENNKIDPMWAIFYQWFKILKKLSFWKKLHYNTTFDSCHIHTFYTH